MRIFTDNKPRTMLSWHELPEKFQKEFDYLDEDEKHDDRFVYYKKWLYDLHEFTVASEDFHPWEGIQAETFDSGVLMRQYGDEVIMGEYYS